MPEPVDDINTELRHAAIDGKVDKCKMLIKKGADVNQQNQHQNTALHLAALYGHSDVVQYLIRQKANIDVTNMNGQTPLQVACMKGHMAVVKLFTEENCALDAETEYTGFTALHFASNGGHAEICQHLLDCGATEVINDYADQIPEFYAANEPTEEVFRKRKPKSEPKPKTPPLQRVKTPVRKIKTPPPKAETPPPKAETPPPKPETPPPPTVAPPTKHDTPPVSPIPELKARAEASVSEADARTKAQPKEPEERRPRDDWVPKRNTIKIHNSLDYNFKHDKSRYDYKQKDANVKKMKHHDFEWSEDYKKRSNQSVFDRLLGGGAKKGAEPAKKGAEPTTANKKQNKVNKK